jgi:dGTPase
VAQGRLEAAQPQSVEEIRAMGLTIIRFSKPLYQELKAIRSFLFTRMYRAPSVVVMRAEVTQVINGLFPLFMANPALLPAEWAHDIETIQSEVELARMVADYVAGMTDRFALQEGARLLG